MIGKYFFLPSGWWVNTRTKWIETGMVITHTDPIMFQTNAKETSFACLSMNSKNAQKDPAVQRKRNNWFSRFFGFRAKTKTPRPKVIDAEIRHNMAMTGI